MITALFASTLAIPAVIDHEQPMRRQDVVAICEERVARDEKPCAVVDVEGKVCFAYMDFNGQSTSIHCFPREDEQ